MARNIVRWVGAAMAGAAIVSIAPLGCSSGGTFGAAAVGQSDADIPDGVAQEIRTCAAKHMQHLGSAQHTVSFDVLLASNGEVDSVALRESTLGDQALEGCMASALRSLSRATFRCANPEGSLLALSRLNRASYWARRRPSSALSRHHVCWR